MKSTRILLPFVLLASASNMQAAAAQSTAITTWQLSTKCPGAYEPTDEVIKQIESTTRSKIFKDANVECIKHLLELKKTALKEKKPFKTYFELQPAESVERNIVLFDVAYLSPKFDKGKLREAWAIVDNQPSKHADHKANGCYAWNKVDGSWIAQEVETYPEVEISQELIDAKNKIIQGFKLPDAAPQSSFDHNRSYRWVKKLIGPQPKEGTTKTRPHYKPIMQNKRKPQQTAKPLSVATIRNRLRKTEETITRLLNDPKKHKIRLANQHRHQQKLQNKLHSNLALLCTLHETTASKNELSLQKELGTLTKKRDALLKELNLDPTTAYYLKTVVDVGNKQMTVAHILQAAFSGKWATQYKRSGMLPMCAAAVQHVPDNSWRIFGTYEPQEVKKYNQINAQLEQIEQTIESSSDNDEKISLLEQQDQLTKKKNSHAETIVNRAIEQLLPLIPDKLWKDTKAFESKLNDLVIVTREIKSLQTAQQELAPAGKAVESQIAQNVAALAHPKMRNLVQKKLKAVNAESSEGEKSRKQIRKDLWQDKALYAQAIATALECSTAEAKTLASYESIKKEQPKAPAAAAQKKRN